MRYLLVITILLSLVMPVWAQGDDDQFYTIDSEGWFVVTADDGDVFYVNNEDVVPEDGTTVLDLLSPDDIVLNIAVAFREDEDGNISPSDPMLFTGVRLGTWIFYSAFESDMPSDATFVFSDVETMKFNDIEFQCVSLEIVDYGIVATCAYATDNYTVFYDFWYHPDTDIEPVLELLDTVELQLPG